ncbi:MAG: hypothetical protein ACLSDQ_04740 [Adlercreutzia equolifaciens]
MLFLLTGEVQIGKTRWLESLVTELADRGVPCAGVLAPGQWVPSEGEHADANGFEAGHRQRAFAQRRASLLPVGVIGPSRRHLRRREPGGEGGVGLAHRR